MMTRRWRGPMVPLAGGLIFLVLLGMHFSAGAGRVHACSCLGLPIAPRDAYTYSSAVFSGTLVSADEWGAAEFEVHTLWKGPLTTRILAYHPSNCAYDFGKVLKGTEYLVYGGWSDVPGALGAGIGVSKCGRTRPLSRAEEDLEVLGEGISLADGVAPSPSVLPQDEPPVLPPEDGRGWLSEAEVRVPWVVVPGAAMRPAPSVWTVLLLVGIAGALAGWGRLASRSSSRRS